MQAKDTIQLEMTAAATEGRPQRGPNSGRGASAGAKYSRLDSDIAAMQRDSSTYCDEPADTAAYSAWLQVRVAFESGDFDALLVIMRLHSSRADRQCWEMQTFDLEKSKADIEAVVRDNTFMAELQVRTPDPRVMFVCFDHCIGSVLLLLRGHQARLCQCLRKSCIAPAGAHRATHCGARHILATLLLPAAPAEGGRRAACRAGSPRLGTARRRGTVGS